MLYLRIIDDEIPIYIFPTESVTNSITGERIEITYEIGEHEISWELMARYSTVMKDFWDLQLDLGEIYDR